jgi:hypothetical protein
MRFESRKGQNEKKMKKNAFYNFEKMYLFIYLFIGPLDFHFKDDF